MNLKDLINNKYKTKEEMIFFISSFFPDYVDLLFKDLENVYNYAFLTDNVFLLSTLKTHSHLFSDKYKEKTIHIFRSITTDECLNAISFSSLNCFEYLTKNITDTKRWQEFFVTLTQLSSNDNTEKFYSIIKNKLNNLNSDIYLSKSIVENLIINNHIKILKDIDEKKLYPIIKKNIHSFLICSLNPFTNSQNTYHFLQNEFVNELSYSEINEFLNHLFKKHNKDLFTLNSEILKDFLIIPHLKLNKKTIDNFYSLFKNAPDNPEYIDMYKLVSKHSLKNNIIDKFKSLHLTATNKPKNLIKI